MTITVEGVMTAARAMAATLDVPVRSLIAFTPQGDFSPYVAIDGDDIHWIMMDRGREDMHLTTRSLDELMHWLAVKQTFHMARGWQREQCNAFPNEKVTSADVLAKQVELLHRLNAEWATQARARGMAHPFV
ncbi:Imm63 family immunity protein [Streptomyces klenkii]|uniref:Imm63 family immunity protein n=1 Tax=Streptomyces klenkii TaxID=1420899 RepID=UPI003431391E